MFTDLFCEAQTNYISNVVLFICLVAAAVTFRRERQIYLLTQSQQQK